MLSLQKCRFLLGTDCNLTDAQLEQLRQALYAWSEVAIGALCAQKGCSNNLGAPIASPMLSAIPNDERPSIEERAAILEFEAGLKRPEADRQAFGEWVESKKSSALAPKSHPKKIRRALTIII